MKSSRQFLWGIFGGLVGMGLFVLGYFVVVYGPYLVDYYASERVDATVQNVFQQDIANDWGAIEQSIGPESDYELQNFYLEYTNTGEIQSLFWAVQERQEDGSCEVYSIGRHGSEYRIDQMSTSDTGSCNPEPAMPLDQFWNVMTSDLIRGTAPQEPYDFIALGVQSQLTTIEPSSDQDIFAWDGSQLQGPIHSGQGYLVEQIVFRSADGAIPDRKVFLIGGGINR